MAMNRLILCTLVVLFACVALSQQQDPARRQRNLNRGLTARTNQVKRFKSNPDFSHIQLERLSGPGRRRGASPASKPKSTRSRHQESRFPPNYRPYQTQKFKKPQRHVRPSADWRKRYWRKKHWHTHRPTTQPNPTTEGCPDPNPTTPTTTCEHETTTLPDPTTCRTRPTTTPLPDPTTTTTKQCRTTTLPAPTTPTTKPCRTTTLPAPTTPTTTTCHTTTTRCRRRTTTLPAPTTPTTTRCRKPTTTTTPLPEPTTCVEDDVTAPNPTNPTTTKKIGRPWYYNRRRFPYRRI